MTVLDIVGEGYIQGNHTRSQIREQVAEWMVNVGLNADHMSRYPRILRRPTTKSAFPGDDHPA